MARQTGIYFIGRYGNVVGSARKGIPYIRFQPEHIKQTEATKRSSSNMGKASAMGAAFRSMFLPALPQPKNRSMQNSFTGVIKKWLQTNPFEQALPTNEIPYINGFDFNAFSPIQQRLHVVITLRQQDAQTLILTIPAFIPRRTITAPAKTRQVRLQLIAACYNSNEPAAGGSYNITQIISYNNNEVNAQTIPLPFTAAAGNIVLVAAALQYYTTADTENAMKDLKWLPCGIVAGWIS